MLTSLLAVYVVNFWGSVMKFLSFVLSSSIAMSAFANGTWHGAYIGKGTVVNSCGKEVAKPASGTGSFVSTIDWGGFDLGTYFYYGLRFADSVRIISNDLVLSDSVRVVFGGSDLLRGSYQSYEDCPGRDICEGQCCIVEENDDSAATPPKTASDMSLGAIARDSEGGKTYPTKTVVSLEFVNGETAEISWTETDRYHDNINLEGKITLADGCELTWQDELVYHKDKPEEVQETLHCLGGRCRWKNPSADENE